MGPPGYPLLGLPVGTSDLGGQGVPQISLTPSATPRLFCKVGQSPLPHVTGDWVDGSSGIFLADLA